MVTLTLQDASAVLTHYRRGCARMVMPLSGGLSHETYAVTADDGAAYALKRFVAHTHRPDFPSELARAWAIEKRMAAAGVSIPMPVPDPLSGAGHTRMVGLGMVRLHELVDGEPLASDALQESVVTQAGGLLASVHRAAAVAGPQIPDLAGFGWPEAARRLSQRDSVAGQRVRAVLPDIDGLVRELASARVVARPTLGTHRDVDPKNVIRRSEDGRLVLVDWDVAADADPHHELTAAALDWGGAVHRRFDAALATAFVTGYDMGGGPAAVVADGVAIWLLQYLRWFEHIVRQLAELQPSADDLSANILSGQLDWGCQWVGQTREDLPELLHWVEQHSRPRTTSGARPDQTAHFTSRWTTR